MSSETLCLVLPLLSLKRIFIIEDWFRRQTGERNSINWNRMEWRLQSALASVFSSPNLEGVHLRGMRSSGLSATSGQNRSSGAQRLKLRSLLVNDFHSDSDPFCHYLAKPQFDLTRVGTLTVVTRLPEGMNT
ncbi:hypothetical protein DFH08DRAFT_1088834 [Mycena albidolilacea]|uniref:Uncharacterized protein n=1 Tax=Mycena albidolilacea TaxID=1033008 RepID=A0AAD6Z4F4_9AGAR|nr:hypothetical protein DFH08DRAFT_1088834 [Mycena albidolilacea]